MDGFDATPVELQICGAMLADTSREVHDALRELKAEVDGLLSSGWQGNAAHGFAQGFEQWQSGVRDVLDALTDMGRLLGITGQDYGALDEESAVGMWRSGEGM